MNGALKFVSGILGIYLIAGLSSCEMVNDFKQERYPILQTDEVTNINSEGVTFHGHVLRPGTDPVLDYGFIWLIYDQQGTPEPDTFKLSLGSSMPIDFSANTGHNLLGDKPYSARAYVVTANNVSYGNFVNFISKRNSPTVISSFSPNAGIDGDHIIIQGESFSPGNNLITIGGQFAGQLSATRNQITVVIPASIPAGTTTVTLDSGNGKVISDGLTIENPSITSFSPTHGPIGTEVILTGVFSAYLPYDGAYVNGVGAYADYATKNTLRIYIPSGLSGNVKITVNVNGKIFTTTDEFVVE